MAEEKKPKIDLKARLGRKSVSGPAGGSGSIPPPVGIPKPGGIPAPPFVAAAKSRPAARIDASDPYAAIEAQAAPVRAEPAAIKIEMSDEVRQAQARGRTKVMVLAAVTALVGGLVGFTFGGSKARGDANKAAVEGARLLVQDVEKANAEVQKLADTLKSAREKLGKGEYPAEAVSALGGINIPFTGANLGGKGIGRFKSEIITALIDYASGAEEANDQKEKLQNLLVGQKAGIQEFLDQQKKPKVRWTGMVINGPGGPWISMSNAPKPFFAEVKEEKWPEEFEVKDGQNTVKIKRYTSGNPMSSDPVFLPVDPVSANAVCPSDVLFKLRREVADMEKVLRGDSSDPTNEVTGLIDRGQKLLEQLKRIGRDG